MAGIHQGSQVEKTESDVAELNVAASRFFDRVGLGSDCARVYSELARLSSATEQALASRCGLPPDQVSTAVGKLVDSGFVRVSKEGLREIWVLRPDAGLAAAIHGAEQRAANELSRLSELRPLAAAFGDSLSQFRKGDDATSFERLENAEAAVSRLHELNHHTQKEILTCVPIKPVGATLAGARTEDAKLLARGVRVRGIYLQSCRNDPAIMEYLEWMHVQGAGVRLAPTLPARLQIFDRRTAVIAESIDGTKPGAILVHSEGLVSALLRLFDVTWDQAQAPFGLVPTTADLTAQQRDMVRLLAQGSKDEAVARQMGISARTVRRVISELSADVGAASRFELGVKCAELGWTSRHPRVHDV